MSPRHSRATVDADPSLRSDLAASPRHSSSLSPRHSLQFRSSPTTPVTPERVVPDSAPSSSMQSTRPTYPSPGNSSPMHSQDGKHTAQKFVELSSIWCQLVAFFGSKNEPSRFHEYLLEEDYLNCDWADVPVEVPLQRKSIFSLETKKG
ncbi:hypothetical protein AK812_SmicGene3411 [Symbiodinium microadriaticum]|uniref:Uncharacterized protein n=1 Tax=Symbiodinium microadriaticum TaxID=2951 RepID=A0A1Q9EYU9_SYMMI|nr:hypothetical protein AK812_SmicGene3411 [Symbiodinium microadriaticum]